ncbi:hypothetical protein FNH22_08545 [Fulvivirga sp. M361]|uniref:hypothetical protein n=1 Tax=Fulvivirga sp. M361 TaxID=2594266 RepID=UPI00117A560D|nr:hypothetical protein [Fulvivirga sp. M361]TRX60089.1 hypothetical protein FNH22_08545 [Fulvivirga sp. M361]
MDVLIFKTNISSKKSVLELEPVLEEHPYVIIWSVDTEDIDNVLRVETSGNISEYDIIDLVRTNGFYCEVLGD